LFFHGIVFGTSSGVPQLDECTLARLVCHYLVSTIPDEGLPEVARALEDCRDYYLEEVNRQPELPPAREIVKAQVGRTYERPTFALAEE
jgi:hypothetical protein